MKRNFSLLLILFLTACAPAQPAAPSQPPATPTVILPTATPTTTPEPTATPFPAISPNLLTQAGLTGEVVYWQDATTGQWFAGSAEQDGKLILQGGVWTPIPPGFREFIQAGGRFDGEKWVDADGKAKYTQDANGNPVELPQEPELTTYTLPLKNGGTHDFPAFVADPEAKDPKEESRKIIQTGINWLANYPGVKTNYMLQQGDSRDSKNLIIPKPYEMLPIVILGEKDSPSTRLQLFGMIKDGVVKLSVPWTNEKGNFDYMEVVLVGLDLDYVRSLYSGDAAMGIFPLTFDLQP